MLMDQVSWRPEADTLKDTLDSDLEWSATAISGWEVDGVNHHDGEDSLHRSVDEPLPSYSVIGQLSAVVEGPSAVRFRCKTGPNVQITVTADDRLVVPPETDWELFTVDVSVSDASRAVWQVQQVGAQENHVSNVWIDAVEVVPHERVPMAEALDSPGLI